jgi:hypothetical protein
MAGQYAYEFPPFQFRVRSAFDNFDSIVLIRLLSIIVGVTHCALPDVFLIKRVPDLSLYFNAERLRRLCAGHDSDQSPFHCSTLCFSFLNSKFSYGFREESRSMPMALPVPSREG